MASFLLPSPLPTWPPGTGFGTGRISLGELEVALITTFTQVWTISKGGPNNEGASFFKPTNLPLGFSSLGYYSQPKNDPLEGWVLAAKSNSSTIPVSEIDAKVSPLPPLSSAVGYKLVWSSTEWKQVGSGPAFFWLPSSPDGYKALGYIITNTENAPELDEIMCVREDLTDIYAIDSQIWSTDPSFPFYVWALKPFTIGTEAKGVPVGTFYCSNSSDTSGSLPIACLKSSDSVLNALPNLEQLDALVSVYGPTIFFHPDEQYLPSSVYWFLGKANLYRKGEATPVKISVDGSNLPAGGTNDGEYWIDLPADGSAEVVKQGYLPSAEVYIHAKPMLGGLCTDLAMWLYYPFNGPSTAKVGILNLKLGRIGEHLSDWEHVTLRICNMNGELKAIYFSQHSGGTWVKASGLEYLSGNKGVVYSSKNGHSSFPHPGLVLQGDQKLGIGIRNDSARSKHFLDTSMSYKIVSCEYLHEGGEKETVTEPPWLQYMREWGPKIEYDTKAEIDKLSKRFPLLKKLPSEVLEEEGPTGPKEKSSWYWDEKNHPISKSQG